MSAIAGFFGKLFGTDKAIEKGIDVVSNGLDKLIYTSEEKADDAASDRSEARKMTIEWMRTTQGQNLARRLLALIVTATWLFMYLLSTALDVASIWSETHLKALQETAGAIGTRATEMNGAMMLILGFYFAAPHMRGIVTAAMNKFGGNNGNKKEA